MKNQELIPQEVHDKIGESQVVADEVSAFAIETATDYAEAAGMLKKVKAKYKELETKRKAITQPLDASKREVMDLFREPLENLKEAEAGIKGSIVRYDTEMARIQAEKQRKLDEAARAEEAKLRSEAEKNAVVEDVMGNTEKSAEIRQEAAQTVVPAAVVPKMVPKVASLSMREVWKFRVVSPALVPREYLMPDEKMIGAVVRAKKGSVEIAGVEIYCDRTPASASA